MEADTSQLPPVIQAMLNKDFYEHPVNDEIQLIQTHISFVLLTGDHAYKVKKAVQFNFLDFTSLENRKYYCEEELRLNKRIAPDIYEKITGIGEKEGKYFPCNKEDQDANIVDYAVVMNAFSQNNLLSELFEQRKLPPERIDELSKKVATFHLQADIPENAYKYGKTDNIKKISDNNFEQVEQYKGSIIPADQFDRIKEYTDDFFYLNKELFWERTRDDKIRECHGDLHLKNICIYQDAIQIFDCIEFNPDFRNIDVIYDLAFLFMDLEFRGATEYANQLLNQYLERTGDYHGAQLLPLYSSMRAFIRGMVQSLMSDDDELPEEEQENARKKARQYFQLSEGYIKRSKGSLAIVCGISGSGKSTIANALAPVSCAIHIRSDAVRKHLAGVPLEEHRDDIYTPEDTKNTYQETIIHGIALAMKGYNVILDATFSSSTFRENIRSKCERLKIPFAILYCNAPRPVLEERLQARQNDISDADESLLDQQLASFDNFSEEEKEVLKTVDTTSDFNIQNLAREIFSRN